MKFNIQQEIFKSALAKVSRMIHNKAIVPAHKNVELILKDNTLAVHACSGESTLGLLIHNISIEDSKGPSKIVVEYKPLFELISKLPDCNLSVAMNDINMTVDKVSGLKSAYKLVSFPIKEFEDLLMQRLQSELTTISLPANVLMQEVNRASNYLAEQGLTNIPFQHVLLRFKDNLLQIIGSDRTQAYRYNLPIDKNVTSDYLLSPRTIAALSQVFRNETTVDVRATSSMMEFFSNDNYFITSVVQQFYPDVSRILDNTPKMTFNAPKDDLSDCLSRISIVSSEGIDTHRISIHIDKDYITLSGGETANVGVEEVPIAGYDGVIMDLLINPHKLLHGLSACGDSVFFGMISPESPVTIKSAPDSNDLFMLMPFTMANITR